jgi:hypothetical protein
MSAPTIVPANPPRPPRIDVPPTTAAAQAVRVELADEAGSEHADADGTAAHARLAGDSIRFRALLQAIDQTSSRLDSRTSRWRW